MTMITVFADELFSFMALKYEIVAPNYPRGSSIPVEDYDWSASDEFTVEIGHAVMMLSYAYRSAFKKHFNNLSTVLNASNAVYYPLVFAKVTYKSHSPLKILVLCAFISELYLFLFFKTGSRNSIRHYLRPCTATFNCVYKAVLSEVDDPIPKWNDVKRVASLLADGYEVFRPIMETEHPSESKHFFSSVQSLVNPVVPPAEAVREPVAGASSSEISVNQDTGTKTVPNEDATLDASSSAASNLPEIAEKDEAGSSKMSKSAKKRARAKAKIAAMKAANDDVSTKETGDPNVPGESNVDEECLSKFSNLTLKGSAAGKESESEESGEETLV